MILWSLLIIVTDTEIGIVAWGVGLFTGYTARLIGRGVSSEIGMAAAISALVAILGGQFFATRHAVNELKDTIIGGKYEAYVEYAKEAVAAKTDAQIRELLAAQETEEGFTVEPAQITTAAVNEFKKEELPQLKLAASGQLSRTAFEAAEGAAFDAIFTTGFLLKHSFSIFTLLWIFLGVGSAYKLGSGA